MLLPQGTIYERIDCVARIFPFPGAHLVIVIPETCMVIMPPCFRRQRGKPESTQIRDTIEPSFIF